MTEIEKFDMHVGKKYVLHGGTLITGAATHRADAEHTGADNTDPDLVIEDGTIVLADSRIEEVGATDEVLFKYRNSSDYTFISIEGRVVVPGLINAHTHFPDTLFRGLVEGLPLEKWLEHLWKAERATIESDTVYLASLLASAELLRGGVSTAVDMFWFPDRALEAAQEAGIRIATGPLFFDGNNPEERSREQQLDFAVRFLADHIDDTLLIPSLMPHGTYTVDKTTFAEIKRIIDQSPREVLFHTHASETEREVKTVREAYGLGPVELLDSLGLLDGKSLLAHGVHFTEGDIDIIRRRKSGVVYNPLSNLKLGSGIAPVPSIRRAGVPVGLGTDGPVSSNDLNMWTALRFAVLLQNGVHRNPTELTAEDGFSFATLEGARALGMEAELGSLEEGKKADITVLDTDKAHLVPRFSPFPWLAYTVGREDVTDLFVDGRHVLKEGKLTSIDEETVIREVRKLIPQIEGVYS